VTASPKRWLILTLYSLVGIFNFAMWLTYASLPSATSATFTRAAAWMINLLSVIVGFGYLVGAVPAGGVLGGRGGLRRGVVWACAINSVSGVLRWAGGRLASFWLVLGGQLLVGIAQPFFMAAPAQLSMEWFPQNERGLATSIAILSQVLGQAIIFLVGPAVGRLPELVLAQGVATLLLSALVLLAFSEPPNEGETQAIAEPAATAPPGGGSLLRDRNFLTLAVASGTIIGTFWTFCTVIGSLLLPLAYTEAQIGAVGFAFIGAGAAGLLCAGPLIDRTRAYSALMRLCVWSAAFFSLLLVRVARASNFVPLLLVCSALGFWLTAIQAVALETAAEITYPVSESTSSGLIFGAAVAVYVVLPFLVEAALGVGTRTILGAQTALFTAMGLMLQLGFKPTYKR